MQRPSDCQCQTYLACTLSSALGVPNDRCILHEEVQLNNECVHLSDVARK
jgi:hypothetical protein